MKAILCLDCGDIRGLRSDWVVCACGNVEARWTDPRAGRAEVRAKRRETTRILGLNNYMIEGAAHMHDGECEIWRDLHEKATTAPGFLFDKAFRGCWAVIFRVGETGDVKWEAPCSSPAKGGGT